MAKKDKQVPCEQVKQTNPNSAYREIFSQIGTALNDQKRIEALEMLADGKLPKNIAPVLGITRQALSNWLKDMHDSGLVAKTGHGAYEVTEIGNLVLNEYIPALERIGAKEIIALSYLGDIRRFIISSYKQFGFMSYEGLAKSVLERYEKENKNSFVIVALKTILEESKSASNNEK
jgi:DNA-binding transcriptional ArsR family regulator